MQRLVVALTGLIATVGVVVVAAYLLLAGASADRAASIVPADTTVYVNVYLEPSAGQRDNLAKLMVKLPGFSDEATLPAKIDEALQRLLATQGVDYRSDLKPWLGDQLALAIKAAGNATTAPDALIIATARDERAANDAVQRLAAKQGSALRTTTYQGVTLRVGPQQTVAVVNRMVVVGTSEARVRSAIDAAQHRAPALADQASFRDAMRRVPTDRLASAYVDLRALGSASGSARIGGFSTAALALRAMPAGLQLEGIIPYETRPAASGSGTQPLITANEPPTLSGWMPADMQGGLVIFNLRQTFAALERELALQPQLRQVSDQLTQLRVLAALGLGIDLDRDVLGLFDHEAAVAVTGLGGASPSGVLLLRPTDANAAGQSLDRLRTALSRGGGQPTTEQADGVTITTVSIPQLGQVSSAIRDGVVILGLRPADVAAALRAHASGSSLAASATYRAAFAAAGGQAGNALYLSGDAAVALLATTLNLPTEVRDILNHLGAVALNVPVQQDRIEFHAIITVK